MATTTKQKQWWVIWVANPGNLRERAFHVVQTNNPPKDGQMYLSGLVAQVDGPFTSQKAAEQSVGGSNTARSGQGPSLANPQNQAFAAPANPLAFLGFLGEIGHWLGVAVTDLTDLHMWISIGWLLLGLVLLIIGVVLWLKHEDLLPKAAPVPVPVPV